jgi:hypothetical protein
MDTFGTFPPIIPNRYKNLPKESRPYLGHPDKQKNKSAPNAFKAKPPKPQKTKVDLPKSLPPPTQLHDASNQKLTTGNPADSSLFSTNVSIRETTPRIGFTPSVPAAIEISRQVFSELITDSPSLVKQLLPEYLDYYTTGLIWLRIVHLKQTNSQPITAEEDALLTLTQTATFVVPEPLLTQLRHLGNTTSAVKQLLIPEFPPLPTTVVGNHGGYFPVPLPYPIPLNQTGEEHLMYLEFPCLGVLAEAVCNTVDATAQPGAYISNIDFQGSQPSANLLGFKPLGYRRPEAFNTALDIGITPNQFPQYPDNTGFNFQFMMSISSLLAGTQTFKNTDVSFSTLTELGSVAQLMIERPTPIQGQLCLQGEIQPFGLVHESPSIFGAATFFCTQLMKEPDSNGSHASWLLFDFPPGLNPPPAWIANRNNRRNNLPVQYRQDVFQSISLPAHVSRVNVIKSFVTTKR